MNIHHSPHSAHPPKSLELVEEAVRLASKFLLNLGDNVRKCLQCFCRSMFYYFATFYPFLLFCDAGCMKDSFNHSYLLPE